MTPIQKKNIRCFGKILGPALSAIALGALIAGCSGNGTVDTDDSSSSSSEAGMMQGSSAMMQNSQGMMQSPEGMMGSQGMMKQSTYKDGTYSAQGHYVSPGGPETVDISLTLKDDSIVATTFKGEATLEKSKMMQEAFAAGYTQEVVGKPIDGLNLTVVNGSSLTSMGFMDAVAKIKAEAKA